MFSKFRWQIAGKTFRGGRDIEVSNAFWREFIRVNVCQACKFNANISLIFVGMGDSYREYYV